MICSWPLYAPDCPEPGVWAWTRQDGSEFGLCDVHDRVLAAHQRVGERRDAEIEELGTVA